MGAGGVETAAGAHHGADDFLIELDKGNHQQASQTNRRAFLLIALSIKSSIILSAQLLGAFLMTRMITAISHCLAHA